MPEIKRIEPGRRFSEAVVCDGVVYISGQVDLARNRDPKVQTAEVLKTNPPARSVLESALPDPSWKVQISTVAVVVD